jgi:hypothetical protein
LSKVKNISGGPLDVPLLDRQIEADEVVDVPDFQAGHDPVFTEPDGSKRPSKPGDPDYLAIIWPPDKWEPVAEPTVAPEKASKSKAAI